MSVKLGDRLQQRGCCEACGLSVTKENKKFNKLSKKRRGFALENIRKSFKDVFFRWKKIMDYSEVK